MRARVLLLPLLLCAICPVVRAQSANQAGTPLTFAEFRALMSRLADAWNSNDAKTAAACFTDDAIYTSPPDSRVLRGRDALFQFFGGPKGRPHSMKMEWHHLLFDEGGQIGAGEYTFTYEVRTHGMVIVRVRDGRIANWREYERESPADWQQLTATNPF
jgi:ketosteroid isomerase-like protein